MMKFFSILIAISFSLVLSSIAFAQNPGARTPGIRKHQIHQQHRIGRGIRSGELTKREVRFLEKEQREINRDKREAKSNGSVTARERREIRRDQRQASRHIFRAKHNNRDRD